MPIVFPSTPYPHTILDTTALADSLFFWVRSLVRGVPTDGGHVPRERRQPGAPHPPRAGVLLQDALQRPHDVLPRVRVHAGLCPKLLLSLHLPVHAHAHALSSPRPLRTGPRASFHTRHRTIRLSPPPRRLVRAQSPSLTAAPLSLSLPAGTASPRAARPRRASRWTRRRGSTSSRRTRCSPRRQSLRARVPLSFFA